MEHKHLWNTCYFVSIPDIPILSGLLPMGHDEQSYYQLPGKTSTSSFLDSIQEAHANF